MNRKKFEDMMASELKRYMEKHDEKEYVLVDVRQPQEYTKAHIPGAMLMPVTQLESRLYDLPWDKDMVFYCHSGARSLASALLASEGEITSRKIYNLTGGIMAWEGKTLPDMPKVRVFDKSQSLSELLMTAMELEKGAYLYYKYVFERFDSEPFAKAMEHLSKAETEHARSVYRFWKKTKKEPRDFESLFDSLDGEILEGGKNLEEMLGQIEISEGNLCLNIMELSLDMEYSAFDLYRTMAEQAEDRDAKTVFLSIAQAEKGHMRTIMKAVAECPETQV